MSRIILNEEEMEPVYARLLRLFLYFRSIERQLDNSERSRDRSGLRRMLRNLNEWGDGAGLRRAATVP